MQLKKILLGAVSAFAMATLTLSGASAQECPRGTLDVRYCDADGDLIADTPKDASKQVDPGTLIFAYTPVEDPAVYKEAWSDFLTHMEKVTGKKTIFFPVQNNAAQIEAMRSGRLHIAGFNTGSNPLAVNSQASTRSQLWRLKTATSVMKWKSSPIRVPALRRLKT